MIKKILVPIDMAHAERSAAMITQAKEILHPEDGEITLLHVIQEIPPYVTVELPDDMDEKAITESEIYLNSLIKEYDLRDNTKVEVKQGNPFHEILSVAEEKETNLIVIASHQPGLSDYLLGSVAGKVVRHSHCSVMVLR